MTNDGPREILKMKIQSLVSSQQRDHRARLRTPSVIRHSLFAIRHLALLCAFTLTFSASAQDKVVTPVPVIGAEHADDAPLAFPPMEHYAKLWEGSLFTTKALPPPDDAPKGPIFTDSLTLAGIYEVDGGVVGVLIDKTTSQVMEVRIGAENEQGIKIARITPGSTPDKTRLQLQKGQEAGWVAFSTEAAPPPDAQAQGPGGVQNGSMQGRPVNPLPNANGQPQSMPATRGPGAGGPPMRNLLPASPPPQSIPQQPPQIPALLPALPPSTAPAPGAGDNDIPLPPP